MQKPAATLRRPDMPFAEFVALMALMMALTAFSIDSMLSALPHMGRSLGIAGANGRQLVLTYYLLGFAAGQLIYGPLSDRYGRKPPLASGLVLYAVATLGAIVAEDAATMFIARAVQGFGAAAPRVMATAIVRDRFTGRRMARVMSFVMMVFMAVPILAPAAGEGIMYLSVWRAIFLVLLVASLVTLAWSQWRLPETMSGDGNPPFSASAFAGAMRLAVTNRQTLGYTLALGCMFGMLMSYVASSEQIFVDVYQLGGAFPLVFGAIASVMIAASFINSQIVERYGMHRVSHIALAGFIGVCGLMALAGYPKEPPLLVFALFIASTFFCFGLIAPNFNALAMEPMGQIAGTASSFLGSYTTMAAATFGWLIGQSFDNSVRPLCIGFSVLAVATLVIVLITERFRFAVSQPDAAPRGGGADKPV